MRLIPNYSFKCHGCGASNEVRTSIAHHHECVGQHGEFVHPAIIDYLNLEDLINQEVGKLK